MNQKAPPQKTTKSFKGLPEAKADRIANLYALMCAAQGRECSRYSRGPSDPTASHGGETRHVSWWKIVLVLLPEVVSKTSRGQFHSLPSHQSAIPHQLRISQGGRSVCNLRFS